MATVVVIGCGAVGMTTALEIQKLCPDVTVTIVTEQKSPFLTSDVAAGLWTPYSLQNTPEQKIYDWSRTTFEYLLELWKRGEAEQAGISLQHVLRLTSAENASLPHWLDITLGYSQICGEQLGVLSREMGENFTQGYTYVTFVWEASKFLPYLEKRFVENGGRVEIRKIANFAELADYDVIVNCTGLAARLLANDPSTRPIRGQIALVRSPWQRHALMLDTKYIIPNRSAVVLGGTLQLEDFNLGADANDRREILRGCAKYVPALGSVDVLEDRVGLRPGREVVRVEVEEREGLSVVHNYGHGGSGITLAVGCAKEAAALTKAALERKLRHKL